MNENRMQKAELLSLDDAELTELVLSVGEPRYRAKQLFTQLHAGVSPENMTNIGKATREKLDGVSDKWSLKTVWGVGYKFEVLN